MAEEWITTKEAVELTGYNPEHIRRLARRGKVKAKKWMRDWMIEKTSLLSYKVAEGRSPKSK